jgi:RimJ/RimL family protein N-acetyltransferase
MTDLAPLSALNADEDVMVFFPAVQTTEQTERFILRMQTQFERTGYCYFAVDTLKNGEFIGFIGLSEQVYISDFTPCIDIGWRLKKSAWNKGYATEGAKRSLEFAFDILHIEKVFSVAPEINVRSISIMKKLGMTFHSTFAHPNLEESPLLKNCSVYVIHRDILKDKNSG